MKLNVEIDNLTEAQAIALEDMFKTWVYLGNTGSSRWTSFFADGDGDFRPKIKVNDRDAEFASEDLISQADRKLMWKTNEYRIDFDSIAWRLNKDSETEK